MERYFIVEGLKLDYEGLVDVKELYSLIDSFFKEKGYDKRERQSSEFVSPDHKYVELELLPWKKVTDYTRNVIRVELVINDLKEVEIEKDTHKMRIGQGKLYIIFDAYLETDYENRWEMRPLYYVLRTIVDKFIFKLYNDRLEKDLLLDVNQLHTTIKSFLNLYRY